MECYKHYSIMLPLNGLFAITLFPFEIFINEAQIEN
jgi:hypothetical protein